MLTTAFYTPHTNLTSPFPHTQLNQYQYRLDLLSGLVLSPLRTTSHIVLEDILLSLHSHAIDNEHSALVLWTYNLFDCRQLLPPTSRLVALVSGLALISPLCMLVLPSTLEDTITVHTVASLRPLRGLRFYFSYTLRPSNRHYFPSKSFSPSSQIQTPSERRTLLRCSWPMNSPMKPPHRLILSVPRVLDAFCKT